MSIESKEERRARIQRKIEYVLKSIDANPEAYPDELISWDVPGTSCEIFVETPTSLLHLENQDQNCIMKIGLWESGTNPAHAGRYIMWHNQPYELNYLTAKYWAERIFDTGLDLLLADHVSLTGPVYPWKGDGCTQLSVTQTFVVDRVWLDEIEVA